MEKLYDCFQPTLTTAGLKRFDLSLIETAAGHQLSGLVHSYLQITTLKATPYPIIPDGSQAIFISSNGSLVAGALSESCDFQILEAGEYFGIRFYPGALRHFFKLNLTEITDQFVDSHFFPCPIFRELHNVIYRTANFYERANICESWLLQHYQPRISTAFDYALALIYRSFGNLKVRLLAKCVGWSSRHLNRQFQLHTGLSTKSFIQTIRIQFVSRQIFNNPTISLRCALEFGFFDQSHLIKEYQKRLKLNPSMFYNRFMSDFYNR